ncbi:MAG: hypothetical protein AAB671_00150, partial [Patescibacteria group bacterium]
RQSGEGLYAFELLRVAGLTQWYALAECEVIRSTPFVGGRLRAIARFERLRYGDRYIVGFLSHPFKGITFKMNYIDERFTESHQQKLFTQLIIHFPR